MRLAAIIFTVAAVAGVLWAGPTLAQNACPKARADQAREAARRMKNWADVFAFYKEYQACDDGDVAEGASDALEPVLMNQWSSLAEVKAFIAQDGKFETFFLRHVGEAFSEETANEVIKRCGSACPAGAEKLCQSIADTLKQ